MDAKRKATLVAFYLEHVFSVKLPVSGTGIQSATTPDIQQADTLSRLLLAINEDSICEIDDNNDADVDVDSADRADNDAAMLTADILTYNSALSYAEPPPTVSASRSASVAAAMRSTTPSLSVALGAMSIARQVTPGPPDEPAIANIAAAPPAPLPDSRPGESSPPPAAAAKKKKGGSSKKGKEKAAPPPSTSDTPVNPPSDVVATVGRATRSTRAILRVPKP